jgi:sugar lactone lactonase YvrE
VRRLTVASLLVLAGLLPSTSATPERPVTALAPVEVVVDRLSHVAGVAVASDGTAYLSEPDAGRVHAIGPDGRRRVVAARLDRPWGLAVDREGRLLIAEHGEGRVLRRDPDGAMRTLADRLHGPRWLAAAHDGAFYATVQALLGRGGPDHARLIVRGDPASGALSVVAAALPRLEGLAIDDHVLYAATRHGIVRFTRRSDGSLAAPEQLAHRELGRVEGLALDRLGAVYAARDSGIGKLHGGGVSLFAAHLDDPVGMALAPDGSLYVADGAAGRLLRFRAPRPPALDVLAPFTRQLVVPVSGTTEPRARVDLARHDATATLATTLAAASGRFAIPLPVEPETANAIEVFVTTHAGDGLTGPPAQATVVHDGRPPAVAFLRPASAAFVRGVVSIEAQAVDAPSGVAELVVSTSGRALPATLLPAPPAGAVTAGAAWDTRTLADGTYTFTASAADRAGNRTTATRTVIVDNTPPDTVVTGGPIGGGASVTATFTLAGSDTLTPADRLEFAWRLDDAPFSAFAPGTSIVLAGLAPGPHALEAKARDLAGNEDPTPARYPFSVGGLAVRITAPPPGAAVPAGLVLVSGTLGDAGLETGVVVNGTFAAVRAGGFSALVAVTADTTSVTAVATTATGARATDSVPISVVAGAPDATVLLATPAVGGAPLAVTFSVGGLPPAGPIVLDADGDGITHVEWPGPDDLTHVYALPGLYLPTVTLTDAQGTRVTLRALVQVYDAVALDALLQARWRTLKDALRRGDVAQASSHVAARARARYQAIFTALAPDLPTVDTILTDLLPLELRGDEVLYEMVRVSAGTAQSFEVRFRVDDDGIWRLSMF